MKSGKQRALWVDSSLVRDAIRSTVSDIFASLTTVCDPCDPYPPNTLLPCFLTGYLMCQISVSRQCGADIPFICFLFASYWVRALLLLDEDNRVSVRRHALHSKDAWDFRFPHVIFTSEAATDVGLGLTVLLFELVDY